ncbi:hypothetical protein DFH28DRAFT_900668 [Melampsora americana]|nr:hypothetical protein DFH28DRAFT_900668 [Melampsora americana]
MTKGLAALNSKQNTEALLTQKFKGQLPFRLGPMEHSCVNCGALRFGEEQCQENIQLGKELYLHCCKYGAVTLPLKFMLGGPLPPELLQLYTGSDDGSFIKMLMIIVVADLCISCQGFSKEHLDI